jgi:hypothetical protein
MALSANMDATLLTAVLDLFINAPSTYFVPFVFRVFVPVGRYQANRQGWKAFRSAGVSPAILRSVDQKNRRRDAGATKARTIYKVRNASDMSRQVLRRFTMAGQVSQSFATCERRGRRRCRVLLSAA